MARVTATGSFPRLGFRQGTVKQAAEIVFRALERQAAAGLGPARRGGVVTLHTVGDGSIWREVSIEENGDINFDAVISFLVEKYDAQTLKGSFLEEAKEELFRLLVDSLEVQGG